MRHKYKQPNLPAGRQEQSGGCATGKWKYVSWGHANAALKKARRRGVSGTMGVYKCTVCSGFHYGHLVGKKKPLKLIGENDELW
jgi:hypothetical protein